MGLIRNQMISVRALLRKMRAHAAVSVLAAVALVTVLCGHIVFKAIRGIETTETIEGDEILVSVTEAVDEELRLQANEIMQQLETMRRSLESLHENVGASASAAMSIERAIEGFSISDSRAAMSLAVALENLQALEEQINAAFVRIDTLSIALSDKDAVDAQRLAEITGQIYDVNLTLVALSEAYATVSEEIMLIANEFKTYDGIDIPDFSAALDTLEESLAGGAKELADATKRLQDSSDTLNDKLSAVEALLKAQSDRESAADTTPKEDTAPTAQPTVELPAEIAAQNEKIENEIGALQTQLTETQAALTQLTTQMSEMNDHMRLIAAQQNSNEQKISEVYDHMTQFGKDVSKLNTNEITAMKQNVATMSEQLQQVQSIVSSMNTEDLLDGVYGVQQQCYECANAAILTYHMVEEFIKQQRGE